MKSPNLQYNEIKPSQTYEVRSTTLKPNGIKSTIPPSLKSQNPRENVSHRNPIEGEGQKQDILASATHQLIHGFPPYEEDEEEEEEEEEYDEDVDDDDYEDPDYCPDDPDEGIIKYLVHFFSRIILKFCTWKLFRISN